MARRLAPSLALALIALTPLTNARAAEGDAGRMIEWTENGPNASPGGYHGRVMVLEADGTRRSYHWGGSLCSHVQFEETLVRRLFDVFRSGARLRVAAQYRFSTYEPTGAARSREPSRCIVGFTLTPAQ
ncbi:MAG: hypothetical protein H6713_39165 [Myxococcales bacterium]|nr:hypothetical protein [Myxococcales bacterium]MCB9755981.1 hypothetical protein [Myxococcales bacterium]